MEKGFGLLGMWGFLAYCVHLAKPFLVESATEPIAAFMGITVVLTAILVTFAVIVPSKD